MSIATLKRKTQAKYNNMSVGTNGFSLNGTHRNQGYIGQTSLSRHLSRTLMKGNTPRGSGGCCGTYYQPGIVQSAVTSLEDSTVVKSSVLNTKGMIDTKYRWIRRPAPFVEVKPDTNLNLNTQHQYVEHLKKKTINESCVRVSNQPRPVTTGCDGFDPVQRPRISRLNRKCYVYTKPEQGIDKETGLPYALAAKTQESYIEELHKKCAELDVFYIEKKSVKRTPIGTCGGAVALE